MLLIFTPLIFLLREMPQVRISEETADALVPLARLLKRGFCLDFTRLPPCCKALLRAA